ncbi:hypothetical protein GCM10018779_33110 [Streptomyces griseocarneus]|nr:hypothetical protein GCM10018779_33110 [Streptomyces griseocarneus]
MPANDPHEHPDDGPTVFVTLSDRTGATAADSSAARTAARHALTPREMYRAAPGHSPG